MEKTKSFEEISKNVMEDLITMVNMTDEKKFKDRLEQFKIKYNLSSKDINETLSRYELMSALIIITGELEESFRRISKKLVKWIEFISRIKLDAVESDKENKIDK